MYCAHECLVCPWQFGHRCPICSLARNGTGRINLPWEIPCPDSDRQGLFAFFSCVQWCRDEELIWSLFSDEESSLPHDILCATIAFLLHNGPRQANRELCMPCLPTSRWYSTYSCPLSIIPNYIELSCCSIILFTCICNLGNISLPIRALGIELALLRTKC